MIAVLFCVGFASAQEKLPPGKVKIIDGDTFSVRFKDKKTITVRLAAIDAPEKKQSFGVKCGNSLRKLFKGKQVELISYGVDGYGRTLARVIRDGLDINLEMIKIGCAWLYDDAKILSPSQRRIYKQAFDTAKTARVGLFKENNPVDPKDFRRKKRQFQKNSLILNFRFKQEICL